MPEPGTRRPSPPAARLSGSWLRTGSALAAAAAVVAVVLGVSMGTGGRPDAPPAGATDGPTSTPTDAATGPRPDLLQVPVSDAVVQKAITSLLSGWPTELLATARLPRSGDLLLVLKQSPAPAEGDYNVYTVTIHDDRPMGGTLTMYRQDEDLVAQPARDGDGATMVVLVPPRLEADAVEVTTSMPGEDIHVSAVSGSKLALVPLPSPHNVTRVRLVRGGETVDDQIPGDYHLPASMPRPLGRIVVSAGGWQQVQVRTDGTSACRLSVNGMEDPDVFALGWVLIDDACATINPSKLQLLIAEDAQYTSVTGVAPPGTGFVRLHWRNGNVTDVAVADDEVPAFVDTSGHRPDRLTLAQAIDTRGDEIARVEP
jgi:hypothetical protein